MLALQADGRTGALHVESEGAHAYIYFRAGVAVSAEEGTLGETLGRILLDKRILSPEQYRTIIERMTRALIDNEQMRFGEVAIELGYLSVPQVTEALAEQVRRKILRCLLWERSAWSFHESPTWLEGVGRFPTKIEPVVLAATRGAFDRARLDAVVRPYSSGHAELRDAPAAVAERFGLHGADLRFLESLDGTRALAAHLAEPAPAEVDARGLLAALVMTDLLELHAAPKIIAPAAAAPRAPIIEAPRTIARPPIVDPPRPPSVAPPPPSRPLHDLPPSSRQPEGQMARLEAEKAFLRGKEHLAEDRPARALPELRKAAALLPEALEYAVYAAWAELCTCADDERRPAIERSLKAITTRAVRQDNDFAFGIYVLGRLAMDQDKNELAERYFRAASTLDPKLLDAARRLRLLEMRRQKKR